jgi:hypothetical protein
VNGYPPSSWDAEASSKKKTKKTRKKKMQERKRVSKEVAEYLPNELNQAHIKLNIKWKAEVVIHRPRQK